MSKIKDALILAAIILIAGMVPAGVHELTKELIAQQQIEKNDESYKALFPEAASFKREDDLTERVAHAEELLHSSSLELGNVSVEEALYACDASGAVCGLIVKTVSKDGYGGDIRLVTGLKKGDSDAVTVTGIDFLEIHETAGLGMKATEPSFKEQFQNKMVESFELVKGGAAKENQIDALSGATYTSEAVTNAVNAAVCFALEAASGQ